MLYRLTIIKFGSDAGGTSLSCGTSLSFSADGSIQSLTYVYGGYICLDVSATAFVAGLAFVSAGGPALYWGGLLSPYIGT